MEIRIDTQKDSKEHIEHMIAFLQKVIAAQGGSSSGAAVPGMMGMFADDASSGSVGQESSQQEGMFGMFADDAGAKPDDQQDDEPERIELIPY